MLVKRLSFLASCLLCIACAAQTLPIRESENESQPSVEGIGRILQVEVGGAGRFLILRLQDRLAIFDIVLGKIVADLPLPSDKTVIAAGKSVLVLIDPIEKRLQRWSLPEAKKLSESALNVEMKIGGAAIGAASDGPLLLIPEACRWPLEEVRILNLTTLEPVVEEIELLGRVINAAGEGRLTLATASDNGTTFYIAPSGLLLRVESDRVVGRFCTEVDWTNPMQPGQTGRYLFGWCIPLDQRNAKTRTETIAQARMRGVKSQITIHDRSGPFYLSMRPTENGSDLEAFYMTAGELEPLGKVPGVSLETGKQHLPAAQRVHLHSRAGVIVTVNDVVGSITVHRTSPSDVLPQNDPRRMTLEIPSRLIVDAQQAFAHPLRLAGHGDQTKFEVVGGPDGLEVDEQGVLRWLPPELGKDMIINFGLRASLGKNQVVHPLELTIRSSRPRRNDAVAKWLIDPPKDGWLAEADLSETGFSEQNDQTIKVKVESRPSLIRPAAEGRVLVFRQPGLLSILSTHSGKLIAQLPAPHSGTQFACGLDCVVIHDPVDQTLTRWRLNDLTISHQVKAPFEGESRLMLLGAASSGPLLVEPNGSPAMHRWDSQTLESLAVPLVSYPNKSLNARLPLANLVEIAENGTTLSSFDHKIVSRVPTGPDYRAYVQRKNHFLSARISSDGRTLYSQATAWDRYWRPQRFNVSSGVIFPAVSGPLFCHAMGEQDRVGRGIRWRQRFRFHAQVFHPSLTDSFSTLKNVPLVVRQNRYRPPSLDEEQIWFVPITNRLVRYDSQASEFVVHRWDVGLALEQLQSLRPVFISSPQVWVRRGSKWSYQLQTQSRGKITFRIPVVPRGMELSESGKLTWDVPPNLAESKHRVVVVAVSEFGKEENHAFDLLILR